MRRLLLTLALTSSIAAFAAESSKVATVDMARVGRESASIQKILTEVGTAEQSLARLMQTAEAELKAIKEKEGSTEAEFEAKKNEIQALVDKKVTEIQVLKTAFDTKIKANIKVVVDALVKEKSLELILDKAFTVSANLDITDEFIERLEKQASAK